VNAFCASIRKAPRHRVCGRNRSRDDRVRLAVYGGTFDPPHLGHLVVAGDVHFRLGVDRVVFVPAADPPHKRGLVRTPASLRLEMVRAAVQGDARFDVDDLELHREGPSYTVETLREFRRRDSDAELFFLIGVDALRDLPTWRDPDEVARLATLVMLARGGESNIPDPRFRVHRVPVTRVDVSATEIRRRVAAGEPIRYLVPESVREIIEREKLYSNYEL
jgi:nicotinate-nucleotide adenylyltransferase